MNHLEIMVDEIESSPPKCVVVIQSRKRVGD